MAMSRITVTVDRALVTQGRSLGVNLSAACEQGLAEVTETALARAELARQVEEFEADRAQELLDRQAPGIVGADVAGAARSSTTAAGAPDSSDKTARKEFGLTQDEIVAAIDAGRLHYRVGVTHGNPWLRLLRREVEELMDSTFTDRDQRHRGARAELARVDRDLKKLRAEVAAFGGSPSQPHCRPGSMTAVRG